MSISKRPMSSFLRPILRFASAAPRSPDGAHCAPRTTTTARRQFSPVRPLFGELRSKADRFDAAVPRARLRARPFGPKAGQLHSATATFLLSDAGSAHPQPLFRPRTVQSRDARADSLQAILVAVL